MSWVVWITGLPGSGKSAVARAAVEAISTVSAPVGLLELDEMRRLVTPAPVYSDAERDLVYRALVFVASTLVDAGVPVIVDATAHRRAWRDFARAVIPHFAEVQLTCPLDVCREREQARVDGHAPRGVYAAAGRPGGRVPGIDVPYEPAASPELTIDTTRETPTAAAARVAKLVADWPRVPTRSPMTPGWTVWITGLPGSGKTTITSGVAEALAGRGIGVRVLDCADVRAFVTGPSWSPLAEEITHRTLVYTAQQLNELGIPVIVDATAPARAWRELARATIPRFSEVQLVCPADVCATREQAVRWRLLGCPHQNAPAIRAYGPDIVLAYEHALDPELTIHTDVEDPWSSAETVLHLTLRLHAAVSARVA
jgi:adenylylsulfate kinase